MWFSCICGVLCYFLIFPFCVLLLNVVFILFPKDTSYIFLQIFSYSFSVRYSFYPFFQTYPWSILSYRFNTDWHICLESEWSLPLHFYFWCYFMVIWMVLLILILLTFMIYNYYPHTFESIQWLLLHHSKLE